jgi:hypothetical protein
MRKGAFVVVVLLLLAAASDRSLRTSHSSRAAASMRDTPPSMRVSETYGRIPLHFEANRGQTDQRVKFLTRGCGYTMFLTEDETVLVLSRSEPSDLREPRSLRRRLEPPRQVISNVLRMTFPGANPKPRIKGRDQLPGKANYLRGNNPANWRTGVPTYARVHYTNLYAGIDLAYYGNQQKLEYDFVVRPGADPSRIRLRFEGADRMELDAHGDLVLHSAQGAIRQRKPMIYQEVEGVRQKISGGYVLNGNDQVAIHVSAYDRNRPLVIDPAVLFYSTYLGASAIDLGSAIAVDEAGNAYVTGPTRSTDFPTTAGAFQTTAAGDYDAFVTKLNPTGSGLVYSTYLGGGSFDGGAAIAIDGAGNAYVAGTTGSADFPTTLTAFDTTFNGGPFDGFVTKLDATGSALIYSTFLGGGSEDFGFRITLDATGSAYVGGATSSTDFPTTPAAFDTAFNGGPEDGFVTKLDPTGSALTYSTYLGGSDDDFIASTALDAAGNAYVTGGTSSPDYPTTVAAFDTSFNGAAGDYDVFVTELNAAGSGLVYSTFLGGSDLESGNTVKVDSMGNAYVGGTTLSTDFPATPGAFQTTSAGDADVFITKLSAGGSALVYSTYLGGSGGDFGAFLAVDAGGSVYAAGATSSTDFPTNGGFQQTFAGGDFDAFVTKVNPAGSALVYSSYLGGSGLDSGQGIAIDAFPVPNAYVVGQTTSADFPTTPGAFQGASGGDYDTFVTKIAEGNLPGGPFTARVTGGGTIDVVGGIATFSFLIQRSESGALSGRLQYFNHASGTQVQSETYTSLVIVGNTATFDGTCTVDGDPCTFTVNVSDNGEPGTTDTFTISVSGGPTEGGVLRSGNILIQEQ